MQALGIGSRQWETGLHAPGFSTLRGSPRNPQSTHMQGLNTGAKRVLASAGSPKPRLHPHAHNTHTHTCAIAEDHNGLWDHAGLVSSPPPGASIAVPGLLLPLIRVVCILPAGLIKAVTAVNTMTARASSGAGAAMSPVARAVTGCHRLSQAGAHMPLIGSMFFKRAP